MTLPSLDHRSGGHMIQKGRKTGFVNAKHVVAGQAQFANLFRSVLAGAQRWSTSVHWVMVDLN